MVETSEAEQERAVELAYGYVGMPYVFAGGDLNGPTGGGFDRAGFVRRIVYEVSGVDLGHTLRDQLDRCRRLSLGAVAAPGDLLFWRDPAVPENPASPLLRHSEFFHQALYTGMLTVIDCPVHRGQRTFDERSVTLEDITVRVAESGRPQIVIARPPYTGRAQRAH